MAMILILVRPTFGETQPGLVGVFLTFLHIPGTIPLLSGMKAASVETTGTAPMLPMNFWGHLAQSQADLSLAGGIISVPRHYHGLLVTRSMMKLFSQLRHT